MQQQSKTSRMGQRAWQGSLVAKIGAYFVAALVLVALGIEVCLLIGMPMPPDMISSFYYWMYIVMVILGVLSILVFEIAVFGASSAATLAAIVFFSLAAVWRVVVLVWLAIVMGSCNGDLTCADNLDCLGGPLGPPYGGPSDRFLGMFCMNIISLIIYVIGAVVAFFAVYKSIINFIRVRSVPGYTQEPELAAEAEPAPVAGEYSDSNPLVQEATDDEFSGRHRGGHRHKSHGV